MVLLIFFVEQKLFICDVFNILLYNYLVFIRMILYGIKNLLCLPLALIKYLHLLCRCYLVVNFDKTLLTGHLIWNIIGNRVCCIAGGKRIPLAQLSLKLSYFLILLLKQNFILLKYQLIVFLQAFFII